TGRLKRRIARSGTDRVHQRLIGRQCMAELENPGEQRDDDDQGASEFDQCASYAGAFHWTNLAPSAVFRARLEAVTLEKPLAPAGNARKKISGAGALTTIRTSFLTKLDVISVIGCEPKSHFMACGPVANSEAASRARAIPCSVPSNCRAAFRAAASEKACSSLRITYILPMSILSP